MFQPSDLTVVIPTRDRWDVVARNVRQLREQTEPGFDVIVIVDGDDQTPPAFEHDVRVLQKARGGPGAARNFGARAATTPLILFVGDDMLPTPDLVAAHLGRHRRDPAPEAGVLGAVDWHPEVRDNRLLRWMDWSATQFNYAGLNAGDDAHWSRFYSCNVSLKREFFLDADGFDEDFAFYYEDLDCGWRLGDKGLRLVYEPGALAQHLHSYTWDRVVARFDGIAIGEQMMAAKHPEFQPFYRNRCFAAASARRVSPAWPVVVDRVPDRAGPLRRAVERRANRWWYQQLAPRYLNAYRGAWELAELRDYLGDQFDTETLWNYQAAVDAEEHAAEDETTFYRTSEAYLYDLTVFSMSPTKLPYHRDIIRLVPPGARLLDYGCGIGSDGLKLIDRGYSVAFADFDNPSTRYLRWRLERRNLEASVYDIDKGVPGGFDAVYSFDVLEHVEDPIAFLRRLETLASLVIVNLIGPSPDDTHLHRPLDIPGLLAYAEAHGLVHYARYHDRVHLIAYRPNAGRPRVTARAERLRGRAVSAARRRAAALPRLVAGS